tara:strand:- start:292 stop:582 length:291 start_codon:yes stop_codon:yes gene_type:complete
MENTDINKLKVGDKIFIDVSNNNKRFKGIRTVRKVIKVEQEDTISAGYYVATNIIVVKCFNKLYHLKSCEIYKTKTEWSKRGGMQIQPISGEYYYY